MCRLHFLLLFVELYPLEFHLGPRLRSIEEANDQVPGSTSLCSLHSLQATDLYHFDFILCLILCSHLPGTVPNQYCLHYNQASWPFWHMSTLALQTVFSGCGVIISYTQQNGSHNRNDGIEDIKAKKKFCQLRKTLMYSRYRSEAYKHHHSTFLIPLCQVITICAAYTPADNCSVGLRLWCNTYCLQPYTALFGFVFMAATLHFSFFKGFYQQISF